MTVSLGGVSYVMHYMLVLLGKLLLFDAGLAGKVCVVTNCLQS